MIHRNMIHNSMRYRNMGHSGMRYNRIREKVFFCILLMLMVLLGGMGGMMSNALENNHESFQWAQTSQVHSPSQTPPPSQDPSQASQIDRDAIVTEFDPIVPVAVKVITQPFVDGKHLGVDLVAQFTDAPIAAVESGTVEKAEFGNETGNHIKMKHSNGLGSNYYHCKELLVKEGDKVERGDIIGKVGNTGNSTGPHLHFELLVNGIPVNPKAFMDLNGVE